MHCLMLSDLVYGIIATHGLIGNWIAFCVFGKMRNQNASTFLFRALAFVDSLLLVTWALGIVNSYSWNIPWLYNSYVFIYIYIIFPLNSIARSSTMSTIVLVGVYRYIVVCRPFLVERLCTVGNARRHFIGGILFAVIVNIPSFFEFKVEYDDERHLYRTTDMGSSPWYYIGYRIVFLSAIMNYAIPVCSLIFLTVRLLKSLRIARQQRLEMSTGQRQDQTDRRSEWMVIVVLAVFLICHSSWPITLAFEYWGHLNETADICTSALFVVVAVSYILILLSSCVNIIIYLVFNRNFRRTLRLCLTPVTGRPNDQQPPTLTSTLSTD